jgi:hypothetical protein
MNPTLTPTTRSDAHHPQERAVLEGKYFLVDIDISFGALTDTGDNRTSYGPVTARFCPLDWFLQKKNPSLVPMFRVLVDQSKHCEANMVTLDMREITKKARLYDDRKTNNIKVLKLGGAAFHESRCGSTLVANLLSASNPEAHRVYSESPPPLSVLKACSEGSRQCSRQKQIRLLRDVIYIMSRSSAPAETHVFFKIQSVGVFNINVFTQAFPDASWIYVYRDSVEVLMSHLKTKGDSTKMAVCLRSRGNPRPELKQLVHQRAPGQSLSRLSNVEFCAAHVATLCQAALDGYHRAAKGTGRFVNYANLPDVLWDTILPHHFEVPIEDEAAAVERMKALSQVYSKGFKDRANKEWVQDSERKQEKATKAMRDAADTFIKPYFDELERMQLEQEGQNDDRTA